MFPALLNGRKAKRIRIALLLIVALVVGGGAAASALVFAANSLPAGAAWNNLSNRILTPMENYADPEGPVFTGGSSVKPPTNTAELVVVSYNLRYGEAITETIDAFRTVDPLPAADVILLQEMDEAGVDQLARELGYNYVYYPASVARDGDNFGNAILARWPIDEPAKLILPGLHPLSGQQRTATRAVVHIGDADVLVYSTHIEIAAAPPSLRAAQFAAILDDIPDDAPYVIVGGDFNTVTANGVEALAELYAAEGLAHDSADLGPTYTRFGLRPAAADHIFTRGFEHVDAGVLGDVTASDHFPVWVRLEFPSG
jgi:endonuclease/exonuclease/phosphatase family metal-dependent hydrolase